jgi:hypothetical protein
VQDGLVDFAREQVLCGMAESAVVREDVEKLGVKVANGEMTLREASTRIAGDFLRERGGG